AGQGSGVGEFGEALGDEGAEVVVGGEGGVVGVGGGEDLVGGRAGAEAGVEIGHGRGAGAGPAGDERRPRQAIEGGNVLAGQVEGQLAGRVGDDAFRLGHRRLHLFVGHAAVHGGELL